MARNEGQFFQPERRVAEANRQWARYAQQRNALVAANDDDEIAEQELADRLANLAREAA